MYRAIETTFTPPVRIAERNMASKLDQFEYRSAIEDVICLHLEGDALKEALFVIDNIRENKMKIKWLSVNKWSVHFKGKHVCDLKIEKDSFVIGPVNDVLATKVKPSNREKFEQLIDTLRNPIAGMQQPAYAMSPV